MALLQPTNDLNLIIREWGSPLLNNNVPAAPGGSTNVTWQTDMRGNISAYVPAGSGFIPSGAWSSATTYPVNALVTFGGGSYVSTINGNLNHQPDVSPTQWQLIASGGGGVNPGTSQRVAFYGTTGSTVSQSQVTTDNTGNLTSPALITGAQTLSSGVQVGPAGPVGGSFAAPTYIQSNKITTVRGPGLNLGGGVGVGGWTVSSADFNTLVSSQRGITQTRSGRFDKHAIGDCASLYSYLFTDGGIGAPSDEGTTAISLELDEYNTYFHGTVSSTTGTGDQAPVLAFTTGNAWTTDGAYLLNITKGTVSGRILSASTPLSVITNAGTVSTFLNSLPVTASSIPVSDAIGISTGTAINPPSVPLANAPVSVTVKVALVHIGGIAKPFTNGSAITVAGSQLPEQSRLTNVVDNGDGTQNLSFSIRNPNPNYLIFQGGVQGQYISFDANLAFSGMRSSYFAFGSLTGSDLIYGFGVQGTLNGQTLPQLGQEAATNDGTANAGFHLYPGAEVVCNNDTGFSCTLEQNAVHWAASDVVENPHYPATGGNGIWLRKAQTTPTNARFGNTGLALSLSGKGTGGFNYSSISVLNLEPNTNFTSFGGPVLAPELIAASGQFRNLIHTIQQPDQFLIKVEATLGMGTQGIIGYPGMSLTYDPTLNRMDFHNVSLIADVGFGVVGHMGTSGTFTTADSKTVTVMGGIITAIV